MTNISETYKNSLINSRFLPWVGIRNISDYSPFGVLLAERTVEGAFYRNGFQGQERDDEVKGEGNCWDFRYRGYNPRIGRFNQTDPLSAGYPSNNPYAFSENVVINALEFEGMEKVYVYNVYTKFGITIRKLSHTYLDNNLTEHQRIYRYFNEKGENTNTVKQDIPDYERNPNKSFYENMISSSLEDGNYWEAFVWKIKKMDVAVKDPIEGGKLIAATVGTIFSAGTLGGAIAASGYWSITTSSVVLVVSLDEFSGVGEKETFLESSIREKLGDDAANLFKGAKIAFSVKDAWKGVANLTFTLITGETIDGVYNAIEGTLKIGDVMFSVYLENEEKKETKKQE